MAASSALDEVRLGVRFPHRERLAEVATRMSMVVDAARKACGAIDGGDKTTFFTVCMAGPSAFVVSIRGNAPLSCDSTSLMSAVAEALRGSVAEVMDASHETFSIPSRFAGVAWS